jgi:hypothetical protein
VKRNALWIVLLVLIATGLTYVVTTGRKDALRSLELRKKYEREIGSAYADLPVPSDAVVYEPKVQKTYRGRRRTYVTVETWFERPGQYEDTVAFYRRELRKQGWIETYASSGYMYFCRRPYQAYLANSAMRGDRHRFLLKLIWTVQQMDEACG